MNARDSFKGAWQRNASGDDIPVPGPECLNALKAYIEEITPNLISLVFLPRKHIAEVPAAQQQ